MHCTLHCPNYTRSFAEHFISETYTDTCTHQHTCTHMCTHMCTQTRQTLAAEACMWRPAVRCQPAAVGRVNIPTCAACTRVTHVLCPLHTSYTHTQCPHSASQCQLHTTRHCTRTLHNHHALSYIAPRLKLIPTHVKPPFPWVRLCWVLSTTTYFSTKNVLFNSLHISASTFEVATHQRATSVENVQLTCLLQLNGLTSESHWGPHCSHNHALHMM